MRKMVSRENDETNVVKKNSRNEKNIETKKPRNQETKKN